MTTDELRKAQRAHECTAGRYKAITEQRNALVRQALAEGWTHQAISEATGLSRGRISQIRASDG